MTGEEKPILVVLGDRTANEVVEAACSRNTPFASVEKLYYVPDRFVTHDAATFSRRGPVFFNVGVANDRLKQKIVADCLAVGWSAYTVVHDSAVVASTAKLGQGVFVGPLAVVSSYADVSDHALIHIHASIGHDSKIGAFAAVLPGARISGNVQVGARSLIGSNAFVAAGRKVGDDCRVDAMAYVRNDLADGMLLSPRSQSPLRRVDLY